MKFTSSRLVNRILLGLIIFTAAFFALQIVDHLVSRKYEVEEVRRRDLSSKIAVDREWVKAEPPDGSFSVLLPRRPTVLTNLIQNPSGDLITVQVGCVDQVRRSQTDVYIAAYTEFPANADLSNKETIYDNAHAKFGDKLGKMRRDKAVTLQGIPGREVEIEMRNETNLVVGRAFIADRRLYQATVLMPLSRGPTTNTWRFLDSLRLNTDAPQPQ